MSKHQMNEDGNALPKPIALTPEQLHQVGAGTAAALPSVYNDLTGKLLIPPDGSGEVRIRFR
jgi:hypothetical protein